MSRSLARLAAALAVAALALSGCAGGDAAAPADASTTEFPADWPIERPPGTLKDCPAAEVIQKDALFSLVLCLRDEADPFTAAQQYLNLLETRGFAERSPGQFITEFETFVDGNGIEVFYQLSSDTDPAQTTIVLIRPAS